MLKDKNMQILDRKLKKYFPNYIFQSLLATITLTIILYFENIFNCPGDSDSGLVLFHYTCYPYNHFPLISDQIFAKTMVKRFSLDVILKKYLKGYHASTTQVSVNFSGIV